MKLILTKKKNVFDCYMDDKNQLCFKFSLQGSIDAKIELNKDKIIQVIIQNAQKILKTKIQDGLRIVSLEDDEILLTLIDI